MSMNAQIKAMMQADIDASVVDWSAVLTYEKQGQSTQTITGTYSPLNKGNDVDPMGILDTSDGEFVSKLSLWTTVPSNRDTVTITADGTATIFYVESHTTDPAGLHLMLRRN